MSNRKQRLELTWIGKDERPRLEPRILLEDAEKSHHAKALFTDHDIFDNVLIQGDNLLALKALEQEYTGKVKCIFIDPPYNTGSAFQHYDDGVEHSIWLSLMRDRLEILAKLLTEDGSLWITIDDNEAHYLKVLLDEILGRGSFIASIVWQKRYSRENREAIGDAHDYVLVYARNPNLFKAVRNLVPITEEQAKVYKNVNDDKRGRWRPIPMTAQGYRPNQMYKIVAPGGAVHEPPEGRCWSMIEPEFLKLRAEGRIYFGKDNNSQPNVIRYLDEVEGFVPWTWWPHDEVGHTDEAKKEMHYLFGKDDPFPTPKPERLLRRIIHIATNPGDLVLDSFAGSGTTGAVAHKTGRRWVMVELGEHCGTHIAPRLKKVIDGTDAGGVTEAVEWKGGGGFRYYRLAPSLLEKDPWGNWVISKEFDAAKLSQAVCKLMGFVYQPDETHYWMQGRSSETDFIYVTTQSLTHDQLSAISEAVGDERTLLVCCKAFRANADSFPNLTIRKIPQAVLRKCEWGRDDYSLNVANLPEAPREGQGADAPAEPPKTRKKRNGNGTSQDDLFSQEGGK
ncbi:site-specific DNA-methyltransferase [Burkholderia gladioli]|uniref:site-specific DNA-methyltransferase n=1 Tax=Burkholderia gladioli TaxID=28095 RepID=UPI001642284E|nr:site-specific DNA-methyltransferase [Burkholderia gladioli]